jgi:acyl-CoA synthetase (AMP-forming)/AMP-acid ligase II
MSAEVVNIANHLAEMARRYPDKPAVIWRAGFDRRGRRRYDQLTFRQLDELVNRYTGGFQQAGITRGMRTLLMLRPGADFFAVTYALLRMGAVPVLIDPGMGRQNLVQCLADVDAEAFIGIPLAHVLRKIHGHCFRTVKIAITAGRRWFWGGHRLKDLQANDKQALVSADTRVYEQAAILFTSGSTGPAKGVVYEHGMFDAQVRYLQSHYGYGPEEIDLPTFPLFALFDVALGMTAVIPKMDFTRPGSVDPEEIIQTIRDHGCTHMFGSPALLKRVAHYGTQRGVKLETIKRVITAGAPIHPQLLADFSELLNEPAEIYTPYGATESLPVASLGSKEILQHTREKTEQGGGTCVGHPLPGMQVRIIQITDEPIHNWQEAELLEPGQIGEVVVKGPVVTRQYWAKPMATELSKIYEGSEHWHRMGDVGYFDTDGRLWICGRKAHRVVTEKGTYFTVPCEAIFNQHPQVQRSALVGVGTPPQQRPVMCVELDDASQNGDSRQLTNELLELAGRYDHTRGIDTILYHRSFPVDVRHNAKIFREKLSEWATTQLS